MQNKNEKENRRGQEAETKDVDKMHDTHRNFMDHSEVLPQIREQSHIPYLL